MTTTEQKVKEVIKDIIENLGYTIYDIIYEKEGKDNYLRIFIDKDRTINIEDCEIVNNAITDILDEKDIIKNAYMLEVSSPGLERRIRDDNHLKQAIEKKVEVHLYKAINGKKIIIGKLKQFDTNTITIEINENTTPSKKQKEESSEEVAIERKNISNMKTIFNWYENSED